MGKQKALSTLKTKTADLHFLDSKQKRLLHTLQLETVQDACQHYPRRYEDRTQFDHFPTEAVYEPICLHGKVTDNSLKLFGKRRIFEAQVEDMEQSVLSSPIICRWFNIPYIHKLILTDQEIVIYGRTKKERSRVIMDHPEFEIIDTTTQERSIHLQRITPIYPLSSGVSQRNLRSTLYSIIHTLDPESIPEIHKNDAQLPRATAIREIHFPSSSEQLEQARQVIALEEFFGLQLNVLFKRKKYTSRGGIRHTGKGELIHAFKKALPFPLTSAQERSIAEIQKDMQAKRPMNRLLQGDVGSGKTVVALAAILFAVESGYQAAFMVPTQILAEQHYLSTKQWLEPLGIRIGLRTGSKTEDNFLPIFTKGQDTPQVIIGTHALIHESVSFENLGLVIIDEQHKFGVAQRGKLIGQGQTPDTLVMTATPIPRTLTFTVYGDLDISIIDQMPQGRGKIITAIRSETKTAEAAQFIDDHIAKGNQAYIVYPLIEESNKLKLKSAKTEFAAWKKRLKKRTCGLLHGKLTAEEKEAVMTAFRHGETQVIVSTTVIEVGVDVSNATIMLIYHAERFGLAQLHQLRGRIGRGSHTSFCILLCDPKNKEAMEKLSILEKTCDGFQIAEEDLKLRGPGDILGTAQSGLPPLRLGNLLADTQLIHKARSLAETLLEKDPHLCAPEHSVYRELLLENISTSVIS